LGVFVNFRFFTYQRVETLGRLGFFMYALLEYFNYQLKTDDGQGSRTVFKKSKTVFMTFEIGFHGTLFESI
jgi:hypothetical protein